MKHSVLGHWLGGIRLYIAIGIGMASLELWWWTQTNFSGSDLATIRLQESYAWLAVVLLLAALMIGPPYKLLPRLPGKRPAGEARRMLGIGAAWFTLLHGLVTYVGLFQTANPRDLSAGYIRPFGVGLAALIILALMAGTSFDAAIRALGKWWFRLHRLVYVALLLVVVHILMIGVHGTNPGVLAALGLAAVVLLAMHISVIMQQSRHPSVWQLLTLGGAIVGLMLVGNYALQQNAAGRDITQGVHRHAGQ